MQFDYECALTGLTQEGSDFFDEEMGDLPANWTKITIQKRIYNPKWLMIQQVKQMAIQGLLQQLPPELQQSQAWALSLQVEAQFHHLESDTPQFITTEDVAFVSDGSDVVEHLNDIRDSLGLEVEAEEEESAPAAIESDEEEEEDAEDADDAEVAAG
jgi:hypothetical protein